MDRYPGGLLGNRPGFILADRGDGEHGRARVGVDSRALRTRCRDLLWARDQPVAPEVATDVMVFSAGKRTWIDNRAPGTRIASETNLICRHGSA